MLEEAKRWLKATGRLFLPTGTLQDENAILERAKALFGMVKKLGEQRIPLPNPLAESEAVEKLASDGVISITPRGSRYLWEARVWELTATG
jgi:hypothetical protein